jgi:hypothetical protein
LSDDVLSQILASQTKLSEKVGKIGGEVTATGKHFTSHIEKQDEINGKLFDLQRAATSRLDKAEGGMKVMKIVGTVVSGIVGIILTILGFNVKT